MRRLSLWGCLIAAIACLGCDDKPTGPEDAEPKDITLDDLRGTYTLVDATITYWNGVTVSARDLVGVSGSMTIGRDGRSIQVIDYFAQRGIGVAALAVLNNNTLRIVAETCSYYAWFELRGDILTIKTALGTCGRDYSETDVWRKTYIVTH